MEDYCNLRRHVVSTSRLKAPARHTFVSDPVHPNAPQVLRRLLHRTHSPTGRLSCPRKIKIVEKTLALCWQEPPDFRRLTQSGGHNHQGGHPPGRFSVIEHIQQSLDILQICQCITGHLDQNGLDALPCSAMLCSTLPYFAILYNSIARDATLSCSVIIFLPYCRL